MPIDQERSLAIISCVFFGASALWEMKRRGKEKKERGKYPTPGSVDQASHEGKNVGQRCMGLISPPAKYFDAFFTSLSYECDPETRPDGYVPLCVAENKLVLDLLSERLMSPGTTATAFGDSVVYCYNSFLGLPVARQAAAYFLARHFFLQGEAKVSTERALAAVDPKHIGISSGACSVLNSLFYLLGEKGDACLIPAPYYAVFETDMSIVAGIVPFAVQMATPTLGPSAKELDLAYIQARSRGLNPRFVLITNPNNPLGVIYKPTVTKEIVRWARKRKLHTIMDEIYALSTHRKSNHGFESIIKTLNNQLLDDVHFVWSLSKDFGSSGLRFGFVYSQNEIFLKGLGNLNIFSGVSNPMQLAVAEMLTDDDFVESFLDESRTRLRNSYMICVQKLEEMVLPFVPAEAGLFVYVDFSALLPEKTMACEEKLASLIVSYARVVLTPGESQRERMPGMFRICYAWVSPEVLAIGMERLSRLVAKIRRMDWDDLNDITLSGIL